MTKYDFSYLVKTNDLDRLTVLPKRGILQSVNGADKKIFSIYARISLNDKKRISQVIPDGEMADVVRSLLLMYANSDILRQQVREYRLQQTQGWQQP